MKDFISCINSLTTKKPVYWAKKCKRIEKFIKCSIKNKIIPPNDFVFDDETPLTLLIKINEYFLDVDDLKDLGIDFNLKNKLGETPFNLLINKSLICDYPYNIERLLKLGFNPYIKDNNGHDAADRLLKERGSSYRNGYVYQAIDIIKQYNKPK